jgi:peroxiredoxin Q/BCP
MLTVGTEAPDFKTVDQDGRPFRLGDLRGGWVVLYFYPHDGTPGCTAEACAFRDSMEEFASRDVAVVGVSNQSASSHRAFSERHGLNFTLLADDGKRIAHLYEASGILGFNRRVTYIIDPDGRIADAYRSEVRPRSHAEHVRSVLGSLMGRAQP